ncbi:zinc ABC transporter substrate-binding protein [Aquifex pyrophilus]
MRKFFILLFILSFTFGKDLILVSIFPFYDVVKDISGRDFRVDTLVPPKADYHTYELSPRELIKLYVAKVFFVSGVPLGEWEVKASKITKARVFSLSEGIELLYYGHEELGKDPHFWVSPKRMIKVAENVRNALKSVYPEKNFEDNYKAVYEKLLKIHESYEKTLSRCEIKTFGAVHPAFGYLAKDYGLKQIVLKEEHGHGEISPRELKKLLREVRKKRIKVILIPEGAHSKLADILKREYGVEVYEVNVKIIPKEDKDNYYEIMEENLKVLRKALRCG